jgi:tetratricopeptide (TPR) repeat protein
LWAGLGEAYDANGEYDHAAETFEKAIIKFPMQFWLWIGLGQAYTRKGSEDCAIEVFQNAINKFPTQWWSWGGLAGVYQAKGDHDHAIETLEKAIYKFPTGSWLWNALADEYEAKGDHDRAIEIFEKAIDQFPTDYVLLARLGDMYQMAGPHMNYEKSTDVYVRAVHMSQNKSFLWAYLYLHGPPRLYQAKPNVEINEHLADYFLWRSIAEGYKAKGDIGNAINIYHTAIQGYKDALDAVANNLMWLYIGTGAGRIEIFKNYPLSKAVLWSAVGKAYKMKAEMEKVLGDHRLAIEDNTHATEAFSECVPIRTRKYVGPACPPRIEHCGAGDGDDDLI